MIFKIYSNHLTMVFLKMDPHLAGRFMLLAVSGSYRYGTNRPGSDVDLRGVVLNQPPEAVWGYETITSAYHEKPEESWQKIHNHMTALYPENRDRDIIKMIGKRPG